MRAPCVVLSIAAAASAAEAGVVVGEGVPFSASELEQALAARAAGGRRVALDVRQLAPGRVRVRGARGEWDVDIGAARGTIAARLVALNVVAAIEADLAGRPGAAPVASGAGWSVSGQAGARRGLGGDDLTSVLAGVEVARDGRWWLAAGLDGLADLRAAPPGAAPVDGRSWLVRATVGRRIGAVTVGVGPLVGRVHVDSGAHADAWQAGLTAVARGRWTASPRWSVEVGLAVDGYRHRVEVRRDDRVVAATPRVAVAATLGLRRELGR
jgi:hypothetical protein